MRRAFAGVCAASTIAAFAACIDQPRFTLRDDDGGAAITRDEMALVPAATLVAKALVTPADGNTKCPPGVACTDASTASDAAVTVPSFWLDRREVTVADYAECVAANDCPAAGTQPGCTTDSDHPVSCVSRAAAAAYCGWRNKRLVRSFEHVAAAAATVGRPYPWGIDRPGADRVNACGLECKPRGMYSTSDPWPGTAPVGSLPSGATPDGVYDLAGNVAEWVDGEPSLVRGGSYADVDPAAVASTAAIAVPASMSAPTIGFRCARDR